VSRVSTATCAAPRSAKANEHLLNPCRCGGRSRPSDRFVTNVSPGFAKDAAARTARISASNAANGTRLGQQLARESANSVFTSSGRLSSGAIAESRQIIPGARLGNKDLIQRLTSDGSNIADWGKYTTRTHQSPSGNFQVHFYMSRSTGAIDYGYDYKVIFNGAR
jgi:hypothetical protein